MQSSAFQNCFFCGTRLANSRSRTCESVQCKLAFQRHLELRKPTCVACGTPLLPSTVRKQSICADTQCFVENLRNQRSQSETVHCKVCNVPLPRNRIGFSLCGEQDCAVVQSNWLVAENIAKHRQLRAKMILATKRLRDKRASSAQVDDPTKFSVSLVPSATIVLGPPDSERVQTLRNHVDRLTRTALEQPPDPSDSPVPIGGFQPPPTDAESELFQAGCRLCQGHCCRLGKSHAFLSVSTIRRVMANRPELALDDVVNEYVGRVPSQTVVDSCVFHGETGCVLPRDMRSDMCNRFLCSDLLEMRQTLAKSRTPQLFIASVSETKIVASEFVGQPDVDRIQNFPKELATKSDNHR